MTLWVFVLLLNLPSFGGPVSVNVTTATEQGCHALRRAIVQALGGEKNIKGTVEACRPVGQ